ncbi:MAG: UvrD-helicase domain-containing protein, partial [Actinomycetes bacterium]
MSVYFARNAFSGKRGELDKAFLTAVLALPERFGQQSLGSTGPELDVLKLHDPKRCWRLKAGDWRAGFYRVGSDFTVVLISQRKGFYEEIRRRGVTASMGKLRHVTVAQFVESVSPVERESRDSGTDIHITPNSLSIFTDSQLLQIHGVGEGTVRRIRKIPDEIDLVDALQSVASSVGLVELLGDMSEAPEKYLAMYERGMSPSLDDMDEERQAILDRLTPASSPEDFVTSSSTDELEAILDGSLDDWMVFLREEQRDLVTASYNGPSRIGGGPGTGKTVVALHRAAHWARPTPDDKEPPRILLTTFVKTLPTHWETLLKRMDRTVAGSIQCRNVDSLAMGILMKSRNGKKVDLLKDDERSAFASRMVEEHEIKGRFEDDPLLLLQEFDHFIANRGVRSRDEYLELERVGAGIPLARPARELVYSAYEAYAARLKERDRWDFPHVRIEALRLAKLGLLPNGYLFDAVIADEAQDLTAVQAQLLLCLDKSADHSKFLMVGDGQQRIYRGGFTLRELGIEVGGRSRILRGNWRNTYWIWAVAQHITEGVPFPELEDSDQTREESRSSEPRREGEPVTLHQVEDQEAEIQRVCSLA